MIESGPTSHVYFSQRLRLHYVDWGNEEAPPMLLVHGGRDHCRNWDWVARDLSRDYHVIAPDLRGHGDSQWMIGGSYGTADYVYDIAQLLHQKQMTPATIISHSLGASVSLAYTGLYPDTVKALVAIEGMGLPSLAAKGAPSATTATSGGSAATGRLLDDWVRNTRRIAGRLPRRYPTLEEAFHRMQTENPHLSEAQARHLTIHGSNQNEDGTYSWKFDNYVRTTAPVGLTAEQIHHLYERITCPTLLVYGSESWVPNPADDGRARYLSKMRLAVIEEAGHWVHHDQLADFLSVVREFLRDPTSQDPTSRDPASQDPASQDATLQDPTSQDPASRDHTSQDPASSGSPTSQDPTSQDPTSRDPTSRDPTSRDPTSQDPASRDPASRDPTSQNPASQDPTSSGSPPSQDPTSGNPTSGDPRSQDHARPGASQESGLG